MGKNRIWAVFLGVAALSLVAFPKDVDALKQWVYAPVWLNNQPVIYTFTVAVKFSLKSGKG